MAEKLNDGSQFDLDFRDDQHPDNSPKNVKKIIPKEYAGFEDDFEQLDEEMKNRLVARELRIREEKKETRARVNSQIEQNRGVIERPTREEAMQFIRDNLGMLAIRNIDDVDIGYEVDDNSPQTVRITIYRDKRPDSPFVRSSSFFLRKSPDGKITRHGIK